MRVSTLGPKHRKLLGDIISAFWRDWCGALSETDEKEIKELCKLLQFPFPPEI